MEAVSAAVATVARAVAKHPQVHAGSQTSGTEAGYVEAGPYAVADARPYGYNNAWQQPAEMLMSIASRVRDALLVVGEYTAEALYGLVRPAWRRSGATADEAQRPLPGDDLVPAPNWAATRAEAINASSDEVWPWLVQMGYGRGGYYGDFPWWRDPDNHRGPRSSATSIMPEHQHLDVGDVLLDGPNCNDRVGAWRVRMLDAGHELVLYTSRTPLSGLEVSYLPRRPRAHFDCSWAFVLIRVSDNATRVLVRTRVHLHPGWLVPVARIIRAGDNVMQRAMLTGIKRRVERHAGPRRG